jgi:hypothetical protein
MSDSKSITEMHSLFFTYSPQTGKSIVISLANSLFQSAILAPFFSSLPRINCGNYFWLECRIKEEEDDDDEIDYDWKRSAQLDIQN